jgi:hypothetical protein
VHHVGFTILIYCDARSTGLRTINICTKHILMFADYVSLSVLFKQCSKLLWLFSEIDRGKLQYWDKYLFHCHAMHHKSHTDWLRMRTGLERLVTNRVSHDTDSAYYLFLYILRNTYTYIGN